MSVLKGKGTNATISTFIIPWRITVSEKQRGCFMLITVQVNKTNLIVDLLYFTGFTALYAATTKM